MSAEGSRGLNNILRKKSRGVETFPSSPLTYSVMMFDNEGSYKHNKSAFCKKVNKTVFAKNCRIHRPTSSIFFFIFFLFFIFLTKSRKIDLLIQNMYSPVGTYIVHNIIALLINSSWNTDLTLITIVTLRSEKNSSNNLSLAYNNSIDNRAI